MDFLITLVCIYLAYRGYKWYSAMQEQARVGGQEPLRDLDEAEFDAHRSPQPGDANDYIEYEELK